MSTAVQPLVSVITVAHNSAAYIRDTIQSVLAQDYPFIEYIIADDCSTDNTWDIINQYTDKRIIRYRNETNLGEYPNRNKALSLATGKYLLFIDGDDIIFSHGLSFFVNMMERFPEAAYAVQKNYNNRLWYPALIFPDESIGNYYFGSESLLCSSFASNFFKTNVLKESGGLSNDFKTGDEEIRLRIACKYPVLLVAGWVSWPRETPGQTSSGLNDGTGLLEKYRIVLKNQAAGLMNFLGEEKNRNILLVIRKALWKEALRRLLKGRWSGTGKMLGEAGFSFSGLFDVKSPKKFKQYDFLNTYSPVKPFQRGFLLHQ